MWILALCLCNLYLFLLYSVEPILPLTLVVVAMCSSLSCITRHWLPGDCIWKFCCPFSPYSVVPREGTYWETNVRAGRIVLHLKSVIWHHSATDCVICKMGSKHLKNILAAVQWVHSSLPNIFHLQWPCLNSILQITRVSQLAFFLRSVWSCLWTSWVWERISNVESEFLRDYGFNKLVFIAELCVAPWSRTFWEVSELSGKILTVTSVTCQQAFLPAVQLILFSWPVECETLCSTVGTWTVSRDMKH